MKELKILVVDEKPSGTDIGKCLVDFLNDIGLTATYSCKKKVSADQFHLISVSAEFLKKKKIRDAVLERNQQGSKIVVFSSDNDLLFWVQKNFPALGKYCCHAALLVPSVLGKEIRDLLKESFLN